MQTIEEIIAASTRLKLLPGAEPFFFERGEIGCMVQHGFGGSPAAMRYLGERLAEAGISVYGPLLPGHGTSPEDMAKTTAYDWVRATVRNLRLLSDRFPSTFVVGLSMGAMLTLYLGATEGDRLRGIVRINGGATRPHKALADMCVAVMKPDAPLMGPGYWTQPQTKDPTVSYVYYEEYPGSVVPSLLGVSTLVYDLTPQIAVPTLIIQSKDDEVVRAGTAENLYERLTTKHKRIHWLYNSYHVATLDYDKDIIAEQVLAFIREFA